MSFSSIASRLAALRRDTQGGPLAELAIVLPPLLVMLALVVEGGNILWQQQIALKATRDATRYLSRVPGLLSESCGVEPAVLGLAGDIATNLGLTGTLAGATPLIPGWQAGDFVLTGPEVLAAEPCTALIGLTAEVELALPFAPLLRLFDADLPDTLTLQVADQTRWIGE